MTDALANVLVADEAQAVAEALEEVQASVEVQPEAFADASQPVEARADAGTSVEATANVEGETIIVDFATQFPDAEADDAIRVDSDGEFVVSRDEPLIVSNMPGADLNEQWDAARQKVTDNNTINTLQLPDGLTKLKDTLICADTGTPSAESQLWRGMTVRGGRHTLLYWHEDVIANSKMYMMDIPAAYRFKLDNVKFKNSKSGDFNTPVDGLRAINHRAGWEYNGNTARGTQFERLTFEYFDKAGYVGDPGGPDITCVSWKDCSTSSCKNAFTIEGGNIASYTFDNVQVGAKFTSGNATGWHLKTVPPLYFDGDVNKHQYLDSWGDPVAWDWTTSSKWLQMLRDDQGRNGEDPLFDSDTARTPGGAPDIELRDCNGTMNPDIGGVPSYVLLLDSAPIKVSNFRLEGDDSGFCDIRAITSVPGGGILDFGTNRFTCIFKNVSTSGPTHPPYQIESAGGVNAGYAIQIEDGYYTNETLPAEDLSDPASLIMWKGLIRGPSGTLYANGKTFANP